MLFSMHPHIVQGLCPHNHDFDMTFYMGMIDILIHDYTFLQGLRGLSGYLASSFSTYSDPVLEFDVRPEMRI